MKVSAVIFSLRSALIEYDAVGNRTKIIDPDRLTTLYTYNKENKVLSVQGTMLGDVPELTTFEYDEMGRETKKTLPNSVVTTREYDGENRLAAIRSKNHQGEVLALFAYTYDGVGNILTETNEDGGVKSYQYDAKDQLIHVEYPQTTIDEQDAPLLQTVIVQPEDPLFETFQYDPVGNRLSKEDDKGTITYEYNAANQLRFKNGTTSYTYDENGNRITEQGERVKQFSYNYDDMLVKVAGTAYDTEMNYGYDALNRRVYQTNVGGGTTSYLYDGTEVMQEISGADADQLVSYTRANGRLVSGWQYEITCPEQGSFNTKGKYYYTQDKLGSTATLTQVLGHTSLSETQRIKYDAFGKVRVESTLQADLPDFNKYLFTGKRWDDITESYHFHFRQYDPLNGNWFSADPIGIFGGINFYGYVLNNPVNWVDFLGLVCGTESNDWIIPDRPGGYDFTDACRNHDDCFGGLKGDKTFEECNQEFEKDLNTVCNGYLTRYELNFGGEEGTPMNRETCEWWAGLYSGAVTGKKGKEAFADARRDVAREERLGNGMGEPGDSSWGR